MIDVYDFNLYKQNNKTYGGTAGVKVGITIGGTDYLLKYPGKLKYANMRNVELSYSNSPVCEYIGCKIYQSIGIPTQDVWLGIRNGKVVVACKDFLSRGDTLVPFKDIRATFEPSMTDPQGDITNGTGTNLNEIIRTLREHPLSIQIPELTARFWDMFVVDALIGNPDRNNENWGLIRDLDNQYRIAPVFDCGNCLNSKLSERQMQEYLDEPKALKEVSLQRPCIFERAVNKRINPYKYILEGKNEECNAAVKRIVPNIDMDAVQHIVEEIPDEILNPTAKDFYHSIMEMRYENVLAIAYDRIQAYDIDKEKENDDLER